MPTEKIKCIECEESFNHITPFRTSKKTKKLCPLCEYKKIRNSARLRAQKKKECEVDALSV